MWSSYGGLSPHWTVASLIVLIIIYEVCSKKWRMYWKPGSDIMLALTISKLNNFFFSCIQYGAFYVKIIKNCLSKSGMIIGGWQRREIKKIFVVSLFLSLSAQNSYQLSFWNIYLLQPLSRNSNHITCCHLELTSHQS